MISHTVTTLVTCGLCGKQAESEAGFAQLYSKMPATFSTQHYLSYYQADICKDCLSQPINALLGWFKLKEYRESTDFGESEPA